MLTYDAYRKQAEVQMEREKLERIARMILVEAATDAGLRLGPVSVSPSGVTIDLTVPNHKLIIHSSGVTAS